MDKFKFIADKNFDELPKTSGVYFFYDKNEIIYIGKAINIKSRVKNHFSQPSYRDHLFIDKVNKIGFLNTDSEIEALILEANLIKKHQPKFNVVWRDDKNYFYVAITKGEKPIIYITHQKNEDSEYIGPFVDGTALKKTLRFLRRVFPYYTSARHPKNKCTYCHLELCPGPNPDLKNYKKNIKELILILKGKRNAVLNLLKKEMSALSKENKFEEAGKIRDRIYNLRQIMSHTRVLEQAKPTGKNLEQPNYDWEKTQKILEGLLNIKNVSKIECYDVSNIQGKFATASMVVFVNGKPDKNQYRRFRIKMENEPNDIAMLNEVLERRLLHNEWPYPEIMLIDGGIAQLNVAINAKNINANTGGIKIISIAKRNKDLYIEGKMNFIPLKSLPKEIYNLILQLDDEAHRFAITYHRKLRKKSLLV